MNLDIDSSTRVLTSKDILSAIRLFINIWHYRVVPDVVCIEKAGSGVYAYQMIYSYIELLRLYVLEGAWYEDENYVKACSFDRINDRSKQNLRKYISYLKKSANSDYIPALTEYARILAFGVNRKANLEKAKAYADRATIERDEDFSLYLYDFDRWGKAISYECDRALQNRHYNFFVNKRAGVALRKTGKRSYLMKRCYDVEKSDHTIVKACVETPFNEQAFFLPTEYLSGFRPITEELYESFGVHWWAIALCNPVELEGDEVGQAQGLSIKEGCTLFINVVSSSQLKKDLQFMPHPDDEFFSLEKAAGAYRPKSDDIVGLAECYYKGLHGLKVNSQNIAFYLLQKAMSMGSESAVKMLKAIESL